MLCVTLVQATCQQRLVQAAKLEVRAVVSRLRTISQSRMLLVALLLRSFQDGGPLAWAIASQLMRERISERSVLEPVALACVALGIRPAVVVRVPIGDIKVALAQQALHGEDSLAHGPKGAPRVVTVEAAPHLGRIR